MAFPIALVPVDASIMSSYDVSGKTGGPRANCRPLVKRLSGKMVPEAAVALKKLSDAVAASGGDFRVTDCHREVSVQIALRKRYDFWVASGKPRGAAFNSKTMKSAFVAPPGKSNHNGGRAIDIDIGSLKFPGVPANLQLDKLWEIATPLGWSHIIKYATEGASESWHFDYQGELEGIFDRLGYGQGALAGALLVGQAGGWQTYDRVIQALVCRAGQNIGEIDGIIGTKTRAAVETLLKAPKGSLTARLKAKDESLFAPLVALPAF